jgi:hypothetical protein
MPSGLLLAHFLRFTADICQEYLTIRLSSKAVITPERHFVIVSLHRDVHGASLTPKMA